VTRPDEKQSPGGFETSAELRRAPDAGRTPAPVEPADAEAPPTYDRPAGRRAVLIAAGAAVAVLVIAVALYLAA
jgi:hypothetical protein